MKIFTSSKSNHSNYKNRVDMSKEAFVRILSSIGSLRPEQGGALGMNESGVITSFFHDQTASKSSCTYSPNNKLVTQVINTWEEEGISFCGMIHSHPGTYGSPSNGDMIYAERILKAMPKKLNGKMHMPIVTVDPRSDTMSINWYIAKIAEENYIDLERADLYVEGKHITGPVSNSIKSKVPSSPEITQNTLPESKESTEVDSVDKPSSEIFKRNQDFLPLEILRNRTVVVVGCGGARDFCESLARSAVGRFVLVDGDTVSETNIATQGTYIDEVGMHKTTVIANTLRRINPNVEVVEIKRFLDNNMADRELAQVVGTELLSEHPEQVLLCGCTDNFPAQDRTVKLALNWGVPYLAAQVYRGGRAAEVVYTYPGVTEACPRCMLSSRYRAYKSNKVEHVTSENAPIYATDRMNALKTHIALMLLLYGTGNRIGAELELVRNRNLVLMSFSPDCEETLGISAFNRTINGLDEESRKTLQTEQTVWLEQKPDRPENGFDYCPYCAGTGDLRKLKGRQTDTRLLYDLIPYIDLLEEETA